jgi:hypothetical protein
MPLPPPPAWLVAGPRPALMAIGDSFLNGMRSATINNDLAKLSIPAQVGAHLAPRQGFAPFAPAHYPQAMLLDVEATLRQYCHSREPHIALGEIAGHFGEIIQGVTRNARGWLAEGVAPVPAITRFDNLAVAGARLPDVFGTTYGQLRDRIARMAFPILHGDDPLAWKGTLDPADPYGDDRAYSDQPGPANEDEKVGQDWTVIDFHITRNTAHLMNPADQPGIGAYRAIDIVHARRPAILLVHVGANHGLPNACAEGLGEKGAVRMERFARLWPRSAAEVAASPDLELGIVLLPPRPSQVPALMPPHDVGADAPPPASGQYHDQYVSVLSFAPPDVFYDAAEMRRLDDRFEQARRTVRTATEQAFAEKGVPLIIIDLAEMLNAFDVKNGRGQAYHPVPGGPGYDNRSIGELAIGRLRGGIGSLDNFHPSTLGYSFVAREILLRIQAERPALVASIPTMSIANDTLLQSPPWGALAALSLGWPFRGPAAEGLLPDLSTLKALFQMGGFR